MKKRVQWPLAAALFLGVATVSAQLAERPAAPRKNSATALDAQLAGTTGSPERRQGRSLSEWQWNYRRFVNVGGVEPVSLEENIRVGFVNRGDSYVRVTFRAQISSGFAAGKFQGKKEVSFTIERLYESVVARGRKFYARTEKPFRLVESDPPGYTLADFSTFGGIARGRNVVAVVDEAFSGENLFASDGGNLEFVNQQFNGNNGRAFPAQIVMEPVK